MIQITEPAKMAIRFGAESEDFPLVPSGRTDSESSTEQGEPCGDASRRGPLDRLEAELALLVRGLEAVQRRRNYPLERAHYLLIRLIEEEGPKPVGEVARRLMLDDSTVTRQVAAMAEAGLLRKQPNPADARSALVLVTPTGRGKAGLMRRERLRRLEILFAGWSDERRLEGADVLGQLNRSLQRMIGEQ
jgi:DNA-binding MarR family transcriptional regulator